MAMVYLTGECRWAKVQKPDAKYNYYGLELKPDADSIGTLLAAGLTTIKPSKDGQGYYAFKRYPDKPAWKDGVQIKAGKPGVYHAGTVTPFEDDIGNGSKVRIGIEVFPYNNSFGKGVTSRLETIEVLELVEYKEAAAPAGTPQLKIMF
jgi:hypothetical protein